MMYMYAFNNNINKELLWLYFFIVYMKAITGVWVVANDLWECFSREDWLLIINVACDVMKTSL